MSGIKVPGDPLTLLTVHSSKLVDTLVCECGIRVGVSSGGYANLKTHKQGKEHAAAMKKKQTIRITSFFSRSVPQPTSNAPQPSLLKNLAVRSEADLKDAQSDANISQGPRIHQAALVIHLRKLGGSGTLNPSK
jgi:hypothetical protein